MSRDASCDHETDAPITSKRSYWPTGGGYLVFRVWRAYHSGFDNEFVVRRQLIGLAEVEDRKIIRDILKIHGYDPDIITDLPVYKREETGPSEQI